MTHYEPETERPLPRALPPRTFGVAAGVLLLAFGLSHLPSRMWACGIGLACLAVALLAPCMFILPSAGWRRLSLVLGEISGTMLLAAIFFGLFTPLALILRRFGPDPLRLRFEPDLASYWILRTPPGPRPDAIRRQF